jgi:secreted trypsin-like serine protease
MYVLFQDWGGPLVANNRLVGIASWGYACELAQYPELYAKVSTMCNWIVINARLYKVSAVINWTKPIPGLQTMPLTYIATYPNN